MSLTKIGSIGINTGIQFAGVTTVSTLHVGSGVTLSSDGDIFATGVSTFSGNLKVGSGVTISPDGDGFYTGVVTATTFSGALAASSLTGALPAISGANLTNLDASDLASGTVPTARLGSGTASSSTFLRGDSTFQTVNTDLVSDTSPQLGGDLASNGNDIVIADNDKIKVGTGGDLHIFHNGSQSKITDTLGNELRIQADTIRFRDKDDTDTYANFIHDGAVELYYDNTKMFETRSGASAFVNGDLFLDSDSHKLKLGLGADLNIYHNGSHSFIDNDTGTLYLQTATNLSFMTNNNEDAILCVANGAVSLYHDNTKQCETSANGLAFPSGKGIDFSATGDGINSSSSSAELLDDYEEGTWVPTVTQGTISYGDAYYTKVGRMVHVSGYVNNWSDRTGTSNIGIQGLPYSVAHGGQMGSAVFYRVSHTDDGQVGTILNSSGQILFLSSSQGGSESWFYLQYSDLNNSNSQIKFSVFYAAA